MFVVVIVKEAPRSFIFQIRKHPSKPAVAWSRSCDSPAIARREAERVFGKLFWEDSGEPGVVCLATVLVV